MAKVPRKLPRFIIVGMLATTLLNDIFRPIPPYDRGDRPDIGLVLSLMESKISKDKSPGSHYRRRRHKEILQNYNNKKKLLTDHRDNALSINLSLYKYQLGSNPSDDKTKERLESAYLKKINSINVEYEAYLLAYKNDMVYEFELVSKSEKK